MRLGSVRCAVVILLTSSCKQQTMAEKRAALDAEYLRILSSGKTCTPPGALTLHRAESVDAETACIVATQAIQQIRIGKGDAAGMPASYVGKITEISVSEVSSEEISSEDAAEGLLWAGYWDAFITPSGREFPFVVRFDRDTREITMGYCGECTITKAVSDSLYKIFIDSIARNTPSGDAALQSKRGVAKPIRK